MNGLKNSYEDALMIWKEALNPEKRIRIFGENQEELKLEESDVSDQIKNTKSCIRGAVMNGNREEALGLTHQLMNLYVSISNKGSEYILVSAGELIYGVADDMERNGFGKVEKDHMPAFSQNMVSASLLELRGLLENYLIYCCLLYTSKLSRARSIGGTLVGFGALSIIPVVCFDKESNILPERFTMVAVVFGILCVVSYMLLCNLTVERVRQTTTEKEPFQYGKVLKAAFRNRPLIGVMTVSYTHLGSSACQSG